MTARNGWTAAFERLAVKPAGARTVHPLGHPSADADPPKSPGRPRSPIQASVRQAAYNAKRVARSKAAKAVMPSEYAEQAAVIQWWAVYAAAHKLDVRLLMAIPNGAQLAGDDKGRAIQMVKLKATGLRVGAPDLLLAMPRPHDRPFPAGLFIEMKRLDGKLSADQHSFGTLLQSQGYAWAVAKGAGEAIRAISAYLSDRLASSE